MVREGMAREGMVHCLVGATVWESAPAGLAFTYI